MALTQVPSPVIASRWSPKPVSILRASDLGFPKIPKSPFTAKLNPLDTLNISSRITATKCAAPVLLSLSPPALELGPSSVITFSTFEKYGCRSSHRSTFCTSLIYFSMSKSYLCHEKKSSRRRFSNTYGKNPSIQFLYNPVVPGPPSLNGLVPVAAAAPRAAHKYNCL